MILQLQANNQNQLTAADVEVIVRRILNSELAALKTSMDEDKNEAYVLQVSICKLGLCDLLYDIKHK